MLVHDTREDGETLRGDIAEVFAPVGLRLSPPKTKVLHMSESFSFLGFRIQRKRGTDKWYACTFTGKRPVQALKAKIRALTRRTSQQQPRDVLIRLSQIMRGWAIGSCKRSASTP